MRRAHHLDPRLISLVAVGGMLGTGARYLTSTTVHAQGGWPTGTFVENLVGSLLLGALLEALLRRGVESYRGRLARLGVGTGLLGGFTTFSSLAIELERLLADGNVVTAVSYALASLVCGVLACMLGVVLAARHHEWRHPRPVSGPGSAGTAAGDRTDGPARGEVQR